jgi:phospholipid transport system substrate-binding protein
MKLTRAAIFIIFFPITVLAASESPVDVIRTTTEHVLAELDLVPEIKSNPDRLKVLVEEIIAPNIDFTQLSRLAVGKHWRAATTDQQERFSEEFRQLLIRIYSRSLADFSGQGISFQALNTKTEGRRAVVRTILEQPGTSSITMDYSLYKTASGWKIYDLKIEGVSLVGSYRSTFAREIRTNGIDGLIRHLAALNQ